MSNSESASEFTSTDDNPRPHKRQRTHSEAELCLSSSLVRNTVTSAESPLSTPPKVLAPLPPAVLLISLPALFACPPNHPYHALSLCLSLLSIRKCLSLQSLNPDIECRAWTALVEIGMRVISGGFSQSDAHPWAKGIEIEVSLIMSSLDVFD
jgi:hypothetical protein